MMKFASFLACSAAVAVSVADALTAGGGRAAEDGSSAQPISEVWETALLLNTFEASQALGDAPLSSAATGVARLAIDRSASYLSGFSLLQVSAWLRGLNVSTVTSAGVYGGDSSWIGTRAANEATPLVRLNAALNGSYDVNDVAWSIIAAGRAYVLVKTTAYPTGELRAQVCLNNTGLAVLTGWQQVPIRRTNASAVTQVVVDAATGRVTVVTQRTFGRFTSAVTASHLHVGVPGVEGPIVCPLPTVNVTTAGGVRCETAFTAAAVSNLINGGWYVNIHTSSFPLGEVRGQVIFPAKLDAASNLWSAALSGDRELPPVATAARGSYVGVPLATSPRVVVQQLSWTALTSPETAAHIHNPANASSAAPPVIFLPPLGPFAWFVTNFNLTNTSATFTDAVAGLAYVNVHSVTWPNGEIRGQIVVGAGPAAAGSFALTAELEANAAPGATLFATAILLLAAAVLGQLW